MELYESGARFFGFDPAEHLPRGTMEVPGLGKQLLAYQWFGVCGTISTKILPFGSLLPIMNFSAKLMIVIIVLATIF